MRFFKKISAAFRTEGQNEIPKGVSTNSVNAYDLIDIGKVDGILSEFLKAGHTSAAGRPVSEASAMRNAAFNRAVTVISWTIGMLPLNLHRQLDDGAKEKAADHPVHRNPRRRPNSAQTPYQFKSYMQGRAL